MTTPAQDELRSTIPDIIAHGIMEEVRMQTTQISVPEEPNYSSDPYYDAEQKIVEILEKAESASKKAEDDRKRAIEAVQARIDHLRPHTAMFTHKHQDMDAHNNEIYIQGIEEALVILKAELSSPTERTKE